MTDNSTRSVKNPNSPEAIQARLLGQPDPTPFIDTIYITNPKEELIRLDLTKNQIHQRINYPLTGGSKQLNKKFVRSITQVDQNGNAIITNYYIDVRNRQWIIIKIPTNLKIKCLNLNGGEPGHTAKGTAWRNEGRSAQDLVAAEERMNYHAQVEEGTNQDVEHPIDQFQDEFYGTK